MTSVTIFALVLFVWMTRRMMLGSFVPARLARWVPSATLAYICAVALAPLLLAQGTILIGQIGAENGPPLTEWQKYLPIPVYDGRSFRAAYHLEFSYAALCVAVCETACLGILAIACRERVARYLVPVLGCSVAALAAIGICWPALATTDPYEYAATSILGFGAYAPQPGALDGTAYAAIQRHVPLGGVIYGPVWLAVDTFVGSFATSIAAKIVALRAFNALLLALFGAMLYRAKFSRAAVVAWTANPAIWYYVVLNPHADIDGLVLLLAALLAARRALPWIALVFVGLAGAVKITFVVAGAAAFAPIKDARVRIAAWAGAAAITLAASLLVPHNAYVSDVAKYVPGTRYLTKDTVSGLWIAIAALAGCATIALVAFGRTFAVAPWLFGQLAPLSAPWYLLWGLPYALATGTATLVLVSFPIAAALTDLDFDMTPLPAIGIAVCVLAVAVSIVRKPRPIPLPRGS